MAARYSTSRKLFYLLGGLACLALLLIVALHWLEDRELAIILGNRTADKQQLVQEVIRLSESSLETFSSDYSRWDEMVQFVTSSNSDWGHRNIDGSLDIYRADAAWLFSPKRELVYATVRLPYHGLYLDRHLDTLLRKTIRTGRFGHYFITTSCGLLELRCAPVQPSADLARQTEPQGYFVAGRIWDDHFLATIAQSVGARITLSQPGDSIRNTAGPGDMPKSQGYQISIPLPAVNDSATATLTAAFDSPTLAALDRDVYTRLLFMMILGVIAVVVYGLFLRRWVGTPLRQVLAGLVNSDLDSLTALSKCGSDFGVIADRIMASIEERKILKDQETRLAGNENRIKTIVNLTGQVLYDTNTVTNTTTLLGPLEQITGFPIEEFPGATVSGWHECIHPDDRPRVMRMRSDAMSSNSPLFTEYRFRRKDGSFGTVEQSGCVIRDLTDGVDHLLGTIKDITSQKTAERALRESEQFQSSIVENIPTMLFVKDARELRFIIFNRIGAEMLGHSVDDFVGKSDYDLFRKEDADFFTACDRSVLEHRSLVDIPEERISTRDGGVRYLHTRKIPILDELGNAKFLLGISEDITAKKLSEQKIRDSENKFRTIFENAPDATLLLDKSIVDWNDKACHLFGYTGDELLGRSLLEFAPEFQPDGRSSRQAGMEKIAYAFQGSTVTFYWKVQDRNGTPIDTEVTLTPMGIDDQQVLLASVRDISRRRQAEEKVRLLATAVEQSADGLVISDPNGLIEYVNPAFEKMTQYSYSEVIGQNPRLLKSGKQDTAFYRQMWETLLDGRTWQGRMENKRKDGSIFLENATISPVVDASGKCTHFIAIKRDVSHEVALEGMLVQAQKMEAIGRLAGGVAHDFNNILTAILGYSDILVRRLKDNAQLRSDAEEIRKAATRASSLTKQLLAFSRRQAIQKKRVGLYNLAIDMIPMLMQLLGESVSIEVQSANRDSLVFSDPTQLQQVILNLAVNAKDAMPGGGALTISILEETLILGRAIGKFELGPGDYVILQTSDTGTGMDDSVLAHLFEPFFTTKEIGKGTGLGLATVYGIIEQSNGAIEVTSEVDHGTSFKIYLPKALASHSELEPAPRVAAFASKA